jgi:hypothetical protein
LSFSGSQNTNLVVAGNGELVHASQTKENRLNNTRNAPQLSSEPQDIMVRHKYNGSMLSAVNSHPVTFHESTDMVSNRGLILRQQPASQLNAGGIASQREVGAFERGAMAAQARFEQQNSYVSTS